MATKVLLFGTYVAGSLKNLRHLKVDGPASRDEDFCRRRGDKSDKSDIIPSLGGAVQGARRERWRQRMAGNTFTKMSKSTTEHPNIQELVTHFNNFFHKLWLASLLVQFPCQRIAIDSVVRPQAAKRLILVGPAFTPGRREHGVRSAERAALFLSALGRGRSLPRMDSASTDRRWNWGPCRSAERPNPPKPGVNAGPITMVG